MFPFNFLGALRTLGATVATFHPSQVCSPLWGKGFQIAMPVLVLVILQSCMGPMDIPDLRDEASVQSTEDYIHIQAAKEKATLILFPCFPCNAAQTLEEFKIKEKANEAGLSLLLLNFNKSLWLSEAQKQELEHKIISALGKYRKPVYIGGFSSGGNMALLMANQLQKQAKLKLKGVFVVDSPIDLQALYEASLRIADRKAHPDAIAESTFLVQLFNQSLGSPAAEPDNYKKASPYNPLKKQQPNMEALKSTKIRFYTEPDADWWMENRQATLEDTNASILRKAFKWLKLLGYSKIELIETKNKGYRSNGQRHPHSWSIVDVEELLEWMEL
jgi:hypothetical protein